MKKLFCCFLRIDIVSNFPSESDVRETETVLIIDWGPILATVLTMINNNKQKCGLIRQQSTKTSTKNVVTSRIGPSPLSPRETLIMKMFDFIIMWLRANLEFILRITRRVSRCSFSYLLIRSIFQPNEESFCWMFYGFAENLVPKDYIHYC